ALPGDEMQPGARELFGPTSHNVPTVKTGRRGAREDPWCASGIPCSPACGGQTSLSAAPLPSGIGSFSCGARDVRWPAPMRPSKRATVFSGGSGLEGDCCLATRAGVFGHRQGAAVVPLGQAGVAAGGAVGFAVFA